MCIPFSEVWSSSERSSERFEGYLEGLEAFDWDAAVQKKILPLARKSRSYSREKLKKGGRAEIENLLDFSWHLFLSKKSFCF
jgi:hypothetical protein